MSMRYQTVQPRQDTDIKDFALLALAALLIAALFGLVLCMSNCRSCSPDFAPPAYQEPFGDPFATDQWRADANNG